MKWFKHDTGASQDAKIKRLLIRHGGNGYAVFFHCLELVAGNITSENITFELEHDAEIIADNLKVKATDKQSPEEIVTEILDSLIELKLFDKSNDKIYCAKLAKRLDNTVSRNPEINKIKKTRREAVAKKQGGDISKKHLESFNMFWELYDYKTGKEPTFKSWCRLSQKDRENILSGVETYVKSTPVKKFRKHPSTYLNKRAWEDEIINVTENEYEQLYIKFSIPKEDYSKYNKYISYNYKDWSISDIEGYMSLIKSEIQKTGESL